MKNTGSTSSQDSTGAPLPGAHSGGEVVDGGTGSAPLDDGQASTELAALAGALHAADRAMAHAVETAGALLEAGTCEEEAGLPLDLWLAGAARLTGADRSTLLTAADTLRSLPTVAGLFAEGELSWAQVRQIVGATKRLSRADRAEVDARIAATVASYPDGAGAFDPDGLVWAVDAAVDDLLLARRRQEREARKRRANFLQVQHDFDGGSEGSFALDPVATAALLNTLDAFADPPRKAESSGQPADEATGASDEDAEDTNGACSDAGADAETPPPPTPRGAQLAEALQRLCAHALGALGSGGRPARPLLTAHIDLSQVTTHPDGTVSLGVRGPLSRISWSALERLADDADLRAVLFDGARPLAASGTRRIPEKVRAAVAARDQGDRFPGSQDPTSHCDVHHLIEQARGGDHDPDRLVLLSRRSHTRVHRHGWTMTHDPRSGQTVFRRGDLRLSSLPTATRLASSPHADRAPPATAAPPSDPDPAPTADVPAESEPLPF